MEMTENLLTLYAVKKKFKVTTLDVPENLNVAFLKEQIREVKLKYVWIVANINGANSLSNLLKYLVDESDVKELLIPDIQKKSTDSRNEKDFMRFCLKSGNIGESIVPINDGIFLYVKNKIIITIGNPLSEGEIV